MVHSVTENGTIRQTAHGFVIDVCLLKANDVNVMGLC